MKLKQSTSVAITFGPFVDMTDGVTLEVGLVSAIDHATTGIKLSKNGGALTIRSQAVTASTYDGYGNYIVTLSTTDTGTVGLLRVQFVEPATCLAVWRDFEVLPANVYDSLVSGSDALQVDTIQVTGTPQTAGDLAALLVVLATYVDTEVAAIKAKTDNLPGSPAAVGSAMTLAADSVTAAALAADAGAEIAAALLDLANGIETGLTLRQALRLIASTTAGKMSGAGTATETFRNAVADSKNRVVATVDASGNRSAITTDLT